LGNLPRVTTGEPVETPDLHGAYPRLSEEQVRELERGGRVRSTGEDEVLFRTGDVDADMIVVLSGAVAVLDNVGPDQRLLTIHRSHRFVGELGQVTGRPVAVSAVVREPGEVLAVPVAVLRRLVVEDPELGDLILRALLIRRRQLRRAGRRLPRPQGVPGAPAGPRRGPARRHVALPGGPDRARAERRRPAEHRAPRAAGT